MISRLTVKIKKEEGFPLFYNNAPLFHGYIMETCKKEYADFLHLQGLKPYSQNVFMLNDEYIWQINTLNEEARENIILPLIERLNKDGFINITYKDHKYIPYEYNLKEIKDLNEYINSFYKEEKSRVIKVKFVTPTSFKSFGENVFVPDIRLIVKSMVNKADSFLPVTLKDEETMEILINNISLKDFNIKSTMFKSSDVGIKSFIGNVSFYVKGPKPLLSLTYLLFDFASYAGIGVKSPQGMGCIKMLL